MRVFISVLLWCWSMQAHSIQTSQLPDDTCGAEEVPVVAIAIAPPSVCLDCPPVGAPDPGQSPAYPICGDGMREKGEICDGDENCLPNCTYLTEEPPIPPSQCGNGIVEGLEACDDGLSGSETCTSFCSISSSSCPVLE